MFASGELTSTSSVELKHCRHIKKKESYFIFKHLPKFTFFLFFLQNLYVFRLMAFFSALDRQTINVFHRQYTTVLFVERKFPAMQPY